MDSCKKVSVISDGTVSISMWIKNNNNKKVREVNKTQELMPSFMELNLNAYWCYQERHA